MFILDDSLEKLQLPAAQVLKLFRSMRDVQLALPGQSSQEASAYLCQFRTDRAVATVAAFHLTHSGKLAFYRSDPREVNAKTASAMLEKGLDFVESMGFLLTDMDIDLMDEADREMLWTSLPLFTGPGRNTREPSTIEPEKSDSAEQNSPAARSAEESQTAKSSDAESRGRAETAVAEAFLPGGNSPSADDGGAVDELLAAVESLRTGRSQLNRSMRKPPSARELGQRSTQLKENLGRILASL